MRGNFTRTITKGGIDMLKIENAYYNAKDIRKLSRTNSYNLIITYINGEQDITDYYFDDYRFEN